MSRAITLPPPPPPPPTTAAGPVGRPSLLFPAPLRTTAATRRMPVRCLATCHAPPLAEIESPSSVAVRRRPSSLYEVLRVKQTATPTEIKAAYRTLAKVYHPDSMVRPDSDGLDFIKIHNAYATLSDPAARALYDLSLGIGQMNRRPGSGRRTGSYPTRRWESDQCW